MHFAYLQDDWRASRKLTLNLGLRYEYSTPYWERDNILSNYNPSANNIVIASDGSLSDRALINPDRNNFGPRLGFAYTVNPGTVVRGGYGVSYVHFSRAGGGDLLPINGPQVVNAVVNQTNPSSPSFVPAEQGYPAGLADPSQFNPLTANITYMPSDFHSSAVQSWYLSLQRELMNLNNETSKALLIVCSVVSVVCCFTSSIMQRTGGCSHECDTPVTGTLSSTHPPRCIRSIRAVARRARSEQESTMKSSKFHWRYAYLSRKT